MRIAELEMHPLETTTGSSWARAKAGLGFCNITKCLHQVCPEHVHITDNALVPAEGARGLRELLSRWLVRKLTVASDRDSSGNGLRPRASNGLRLGLA